MKQITVFLFRNFKIKALLFSDLVFAFCIEGKLSDSKVIPFKSNLRKFYTDNIGLMTDMPACVAQQKINLKTSMVLERYKQVADQTKNKVRILRAKYIKKEINADCQKQSECSSIENKEEKEDCFSRCKE